MDYAATNKFDPLLGLDAMATPRRMLALYFAVHLRSTRFTAPGVPIKASTIDQYISHVADYLVQREHLLSGSELRGQRLTMLLQGYSMTDDEGKSLRLLQKIPITYPIACVFNETAAGLFAGRDCLAMHAAIALAYGLSLRPGEYLDMGTPTPLEQQANASHCFFVFGDDECVNVCDPHMYPAGRSPTAFLCMLEKTKQQKRGEGGPRAVAAAPAGPRAPAHFCCVRTLYAYFTGFPGRRGERALASHGRQVTWTNMRMLCHVVATKLGLDPSRLLPHSWRSGAQAQIEMESDERRMQQGGWKSAAGMRVYSRKALGHAKAIAADLHDPTLCPIAQTVMLFSDHSVAR